jgi:hypothetical protein
MRRATAFGLILMILITSSGYRETAPQSAPSLSIRKCDADKTILTSSTDSREFVNEGFDISVSEESKLGNALSFNKAQSCLVEQPHVKCHVRFQHNLRVIPPQRLFISLRTLLI